MKSIHAHRRLLWAASTCLSLLSARHLLVELNFHHPFLLFCVHLGTGTCLLIIDFIIHRLVRGKTKTDEGRPTAKWLGQKNMWIISISMFCKAWSLLLYLQALLHFYNLPTLVMLTALTYLIEDILLVASSVRPCSRLELSRLAALLLACIGILSAEHRLSVPNLASSLPALLLAGMANGLKRCTTAKFEADTPDRAEYRLLAAAGMVVAVIWALCFWSTDRVFANDLESIPILLILHVAVTVMTLWLGGSIITPPGDDVNDSEDDHAQPTTLIHFHSTRYLMGLAATIGCILTLSQRRSYTNFYQYICFVIALVCISCRVGVISVATYDRHDSLPEAYELLEDDTLVVVDAGSHDHTLLEPSAILIKSRSGCPRGITVRSLAVWIGLIFLWLAFASLNFFQRSYDPPAAVLDLAYESPRAMEIVLSMYKESTEVVEQLISRLKQHHTSSEASVSIYIKDEGADIDRIMRETGADRVVKRPNVGREGETYLFHILDNWNSLSDHTLFLQADVHNLREFYTRFDKFFDPYHTGFLNLGWTNICDCETCGDRFSWHDNANVFSTLHNRIYTSASCDKVLLSYKGQFVASAARIRGIDRTIYHDLWEAFVNETSWAHQPDYLQGRQDSMSAPSFGYTMERIWHLLFQCNDMGIGWRCPSLLSGWRLGGNTGDCQCFDSKTTLNAAVPH